MFSRQKFSRFFLQFHAFSGSVTNNHHKSSPIFTRNPLLLLYSPTGMSLYDLVKAIVLLVNAVAIINERFLYQIGLIKGPNATGHIGQENANDVKSRILSIVGDRNVKFILQGKRTKPRESTVSWATEVTI